MNLPMTKKVNVVCADSPYSSSTKNSTWNDVVSRIGYVHEISKSPVEELSGVSIVIHVG